MADFEITIIGAGVVGLAIAARLSERHPNLLLLEKNEKYGMETSSRNSEVIHAGIYYELGSLKARLCVEGRDELYALCKAHDIAFKPLTKLITATTTTELAKLEGIQQNAAKNGVELQLLDKTAALKLEPNIRTEGALFSPLTGVISVHDLMDYYFHTTQSYGGTIQHRCHVVDIRQVHSEHEIVLDEAGNRSSITSEIVINAAGLGSDLIAQMIGIDIDKEDLRLNYVKGSYFAIAPSKAKLISRLVYPVPVNEGLGIHALMDWGGRLKFGPDVEYLDGRTLDYYVAENKRHAFAESIRRILPGITDEDISPDMSGIRPKLQKKGKPPRDFVIVHETARGLSGFVNLIGIDSPGLTSSPAIARYVEKLLF
ncbi:MAG: NAD(P)/FAD-dependent oxidoreductase [Ignavibacteriales bacterium]|nr:NAD(P)/FAD-dependent oxidoreductase [Ignavibacteriales bacterium]